MTEVLESQVSSQLGAGPAPSYDVALGLRIDVLQRALDKIYKQLYPRYFQGSTAVANRNVSWDVKTAPQLDFSPTPGLASALQEQIEQLPQPDGAVKKLKAISPTELDSLAASIDWVTIKLNFPSIDVGITTSGGAQVKTTATAVAFVKISTEDNGRVRFTPTRAQATTPGPDDQYILNAVIIPAALKLAGQLLGAIQIPDLRTGPIALYWPGAQIVQSRYLVISINRTTKHVEPGLDTPIPPGNNEAFVMFSGPFVYSAFSAVTYGVTKKFSTEGSRDLGITTARWDAEVNFSNIRGSNVGVRFPVTGTVGGRARGWLTSIFGDIGVGFNAGATPDPSGTVELSIDGSNTIRGKMTSIAPFLVTFTPTGNVIEKVLSYVLEPLTFFATTLSPAISLILKGIAFDVWSIPDVVVAFDSVRVNIHPTNMTMTQVGPTVQVTGGVQLT
jgi:hypothetical protein